MTWRPPYIDAAALRSYLRVAAVDSMDSDDVAEDTNVYSPACEAASRLIDASAGRQFGESDADMSPTAEARQYVPWYSASASLYYIDIDDLFTDTDLLVEQSDVITDYTLLPLNAEQTGKPWLVMRVPSSSTVTVTAHWGWPEVPDTIVSATLLQAARLVKRRDAPFGVAGSPEMGSELRLLAKLDPDVAVMIQAYRRYW